MSTAHTKKLNQKTKFNIGYVTFLAVWTFLVMFASQMILQFTMFKVLRLSPGIAFWMLVYYVLNYAIDLAVLILITPRLIKTYQKIFKIKPTTDSKQLSTELQTNVNEIGMRDWPTLTDIGLAPVGFLLYVILAQLATTIVSGIFPNFNGSQAQDLGFAYFPNGFSKICGMLALIIVAPIAEEIIMRGWLYGKVRNKLKVVPAVIVVSLLFGAMHGQWNAAIVTFILSCILCSLREVTGTIWSGVLLHMIVNAVAFYVNYTMIGL